MLYFDPPKDSVFDRRAHRAFTHFARLGRTRCRGTSPLFRKQVNSAHRIASNESTRRRAMADEQS
jgi:hypothetical protein